MKAHDSASFNIYICTMSWRIVFDRLDHISYTLEEGGAAGSPADKLRRVGRARLTFFIKISDSFRICLFHLYWKELGQVVKGYSCCIWFHISSAVLLNYSFVISKHFGAMSETDGTICRGVFFCLGDVFSYSGVLGCVLKCIFMDLVLF